MTTLIEERPKHHEGWEQPEVVKALHLHPFRRLVMREIVKSLKPTSLLEVGCGRADTYAAIQPSLPTLRYCGMDQSSAMLQHAMARFPEVAFLRGDIEALPYPDRAWDVVISEHVLEHLRHFTPGLNELLRVAGRVVLIGWFRQPGEAPTQLMTIRDKVHRHWINKYNRDDVLRTISASGFRLSMIHELTRRHCVWQLEREVSHDAP